MILVNVSNLEKSFSGKTLFSGISFGIDEKQRIGLVGPNGVGKSTLFKILAGRLEPDKGQVVAKKNLRIGFLDQTPSFESQHTILEAILAKAYDPDDSLGRAYELMARLELTQFGEEFKVSELSGGWQKRVALARELVSEPELLLLDEPTNHLDVSSILWLEEFLSQAEFSCCLITHDRLFLQRVVNRVLDLDPRNPRYLLNVDGDYLQYIEAKEQLLAGQQAQEQRLRNTLRRETEWLRRGAKARQTKQKARIEAAHTLAQDVEGLGARNQKHKVGLDFAGQGQGPKKLLETKGLKKAYGERVLFEGFDLILQRGDRVALLGDNGAGKSTLIRLLLKSEQPDEGLVTHAEDLKIAYFEQSRETLNPKLSVLKNLLSDGDYVNFRGQYVHIRSYLDRFLFFGQKADLPVERLSGGEQARLRLAQLMLIDAQVLILDEPTNDLDVETLDVLEEALAEFTGAVILVTHDRYFMDAVASKILAFPLSGEEARAAQALVKGVASRQILSFANYFQWEEWLKQKDKVGFAEGAPDPTKNASASVSVVSSKSAKLSYKDKHELEHIEEYILGLEAKLTQLTQQIELPEVISNSQKLVELHTQISGLQAEIDKKYERWSELEALKA